MPDKITKNKKFKVVLPGLIIFLIVFGFLIFNFWKTEKIEASPELKDVNGWAWSENIGWIKFDGKIPFLGDTTGLKARYPLDENQGTTINDVSGNGNNGTVYDNEGNQWVPGYYTSALQFDGVDDYARVPDSTSLNITSAISIEAWIKGQAAGFSSKTIPSSGFSRKYPQFQVVGDKIYYLYLEKDASNYDQLWVGTMNTDGTGWNPIKKITTTASEKMIYPQFQVVADKIYLVWIEKSAAGTFQFWTAAIKTDGTTIWGPTKQPWGRQGQTDISYINEAGPQLQVVGGTIYYLWWGDNGSSQYVFWTARMNIDGSGWTSNWNDYQGCVPNTDFSPQFQVAEDKIYYFYICGRKLLYTATMNTDGTNWNAVFQGPLTDYEKDFPQLQVVGNEVYYAWAQKDASGYFQIYTAKANKDGTGWTEIYHSITSNKWYLQFQVVGNKIYYVWEGGWTAEMKTDGTGWMETSVTSYENPQLQVVGSKIYFTSHDDANIYTGEMNSNLINKGDFYGLGVKKEGAVNKVIGFINAGVDGFKYKGEAISDTAGATVNLDLPDSTNWHHLVITYDKIAVNLKLYLDGGTLAGGQEASVPYGAYINTNLFPLIIGDDFPGTIDEIRIYNRALTAAEVKAHFEGETYGVKVDSATGYLSGYAWSEHIGWISFNSADLTGCPSGACEAKVDLTPTGTVCGGAGWVCGWARVLVDGGGWDGWIKLRGTATDGSPYGVWLDTSISPHEFRNFAWGSDVVGWISFNCSNRGVCTSATAEGGPSNYKVTTSLSLNYKPTASNLSLTSNYCDVNSGVGQVSFQWLYKDHEGSPQTNYRLEIATDSGFSNKVVDCEIPQSVASGSYGSAGVQVISNAPVEDCSLPLQISYRGEANPYYWRISVKDGLQWSDPAEGTPFTTPSHAKPWVDFQWCPSKPMVSQETRFCSIEEATKCETATTCVNASSPSPPTDPDVTCYNLAGGEVDCVSWAWTLPDTDIVTSSDKNPLARFLSKGFKDVSLQVTDADNLSCTKTLTVSVEVEYPLPQWKEIPPTF